MNEFNIKNGFISNSDSRVLGTLSANTLNIQTLGAGTPITNLGIDSSGNIVTGSGGTSFTGNTIFTGGTVTGATNFTNGLTANTISATTFYGNNIQVITAGENLNSGDLIYLSGDSKYYKASNISELYSSTELRITLSGITLNSNGVALIKGLFTTTGLTSGEQYWIGDSFGSYSVSQPISDGSIVRYIGTALDTNTMEFNPDQTYIELSDEPNNPSIRTITTSETLLSNDYSIICSSGLTVTLPTAVGIQGKIYNIKNLSTSIVIINTSSSQTIDVDETPALTYKQKITLQSDGNNWIIL
jgi:hypothetical protein